MINHISMSGTLYTSDQTYQRSSIYGNHIMTRIPFLFSNQCRHPVVDNNPIRIAQLISRRVLPADQSIVFLKVLFIPSPLRRSPRSKDNHGVYWAHDPSKSLYEIFVGRSLLIFCRQRKSLVGTHVLFMLLLFFF